MLYDEMTKLSDRYLIRIFLTISNMLFIQRCRLVRTFLIVYNNQLPSLYSILIQRQYRMQEQLCPKVYKSRFYTQMLDISKKISQRASEFVVLFIKHMYKNQPTLQLKQKLLFVGWTYPIQNPTLSLLCSKNFASSGNKKAFRCFDCMEINQALLCYDCFTNSNHKGHSFIQFQAQGGCCDCGNSQLWNQNGFCPKHLQKDKQIQLPLNLKELFIEELTLVYYIYFWLLSLKTYPLTQQIYGTALFEYTDKITRENYETKLLVTQLMNSTFQRYSYLSTIRDSTILCLVFHINSRQSQLSGLQKIAFSLYQVQSFRQSFLIQYFKLAKENMLTDNHPIKGANLQYLTSTKTIIRLIERGIINPLRLVCSNSSTITSIFKQYFEDLNHLSKTKVSKQYFILHFQKTSSVNMAFYRQFSQIKTKKDKQQQDKQKVCLDQFYLKTLGVSIKFILDRKDLLSKNMYQLLSFIIKCSKETYSLAQQRAFAMLTLAYLDGSLSALLSNKFRKQIFSHLNRGTLSQTSILKELIRQGLKNIAIIKANHFQQVQTNYQKFFFSQFPEKQFLSHLDVIYHRIWMILSTNKIDYWRVVEQVAQELSQLANGEQLICELSLFISKLFTQQLSEVTVCNSIGIANKSKIVQFYRRIIATYGSKFSLKQIRVIASYFINNSDVFQEVLKQSVAVLKGKINLINPASPMDKLVYFELLRTFKFYDELIPVQQQKLFPIQYLTRFSQMSQEFISIQIENAKKLLKRLQTIDKKNQPKNFQILLQRQIIALLQVYLLLHTNCIRVFFTNHLQDLKSHLHTDITQYLNTLCKEKKQIMSELQQIQKDKAEEHRKRRQRIQNKRREKQMLMKKNQQIVLKQYNYSNEQPQMGQTCIYCKEDLTYNSYLISYVGLTNIISQRIFNQNKIHLFVTTCGHKIHDYCYSKSAGKDRRSKCFLCKKKANIIIPDLSTNYEDAIIKQTLSVSFLDSIYALLLELNQQDIFDKFFKGQNAESILSAILTMIARQAIYYGLHDFEHFKKYSLPAHQLIYQIAKTLRKEQIQMSFASSKSNISEEKHLLKLLQTYAIGLLYQQLLNKQQIKEQNCIEPLLSHQLQKIICLIGSNKKQTQVQNLSILRRDSIVRILPKSVKQLHSQIEKCPFCGKLTNEIFYCLLCDWKACDYEFKYIYRHSSQEHLEGCAFICVSDGDQILVYNGQYSRYDSYYENAFEEIYVHSQQNSKKSTLSSFGLNQQRYQKIFRDILAHNLHNFVDEQDT